MRRFYLKRNEDESGISGIGIVAHGVVLPSGRVVMEWAREPYSININDSVADVEAVHGHGGKTEIVWIDEK